METQTRLLIAAAVVECLAGTTFLLFPAVAVALLLDAEAGSAGLMIARVAGVALLALGVACAGAATEIARPARTWAVMAITIYNAGAGLLLVALAVRDGDRWRQYVPIRMPETICVMDRVPPGAAAVLINQAHTYTDLFLPINVAEKRLFDAIDGRRSVQEIVTHALPTGYDGAQPDTARTFFERLWWYDQVVFDASRIAALAGM